MKTEEIIKTIVQIIEDNKMRKLTPLGKQNLEYYQTKIDVCNQILEKIKDCPLKEVQVSDVPVQPQENKLFQCPYNIACKCDMKECCLGCEEFKPAQPHEQVRDAEKPITLPKWKFEEIEDTLRMAYNIHHSHKKETCFDRCVVKAYNFAQEALGKDNSHSKDKDKNCDNCGFMGVLENQHGRSSICNGGGFPEMSYCCDKWKPQEQVGSGKLGQYQCDNRGMEVQVGVIPTDEIHYPDFNTIKRVLIQHLDGTNKEYDNATQEVFEKYLNTHIKDNRQLLVEFQICKDNRNKLPIVSIDDLADEFLKTKIK